MLCSLSELMSSTLAAGDRHCPIREAFFHLEDRKIRYFAVDIGGWLEVDEVLVSSDLIAPPAEGETQWTLRLDEEGLLQAPRWTEDMRAHQFDLRAWPPIFVGPFGGTYAPMLLYEQMVADSLSDERKAAFATDSGDGLVFRMEHASEWLDIPAFGRDGELGKITDIHVDPETWELKTLVLEEGGFFDKKTHEVPMSHARHLVEQKTHVVLDITHVGSENV